MFDTNDWIIWNSYTNVNRFIAWLRRHIHLQIEQWQDILVFLDVGVRMNFPPTATNHFNVNRRSRFNRHRTLSRLIYNGFSEGGKLYSQHHPLKKLFLFHLLSWRGCRTKIGKSGNRHSSTLINYNCATNL